VSSRAAQLAVELQEKGAAQVAGGMDDVTASAKKMGDTVDAASRQAKTAGDRMDSAAGGADELASKGSQAAGALGGLGELIGGPFGASMQAGGVAMQAAADSGDLLNAALENSVVASARAKAGTIAKTVADKASAAATKVMTVAQKALNLAQRASPIGLIITGVLLLVGAIVLAYRHSARFRAVVDGAMKVAKAAVDKVVGAFKGLGPVVQKVMQVVARVVGIYVKVYVAYFQLGFRLAKAAFEAIRSVVQTVVGVITDKVQGMRDKLSAVWRVIRTAGADAFRALTEPVQHIIDLVQNLIDKVKDIKPPHIPGLSSLPGVPGRTFTGQPAASGGDNVAVAVTVNPAPGTTSAQAAQQAQGTMDAIDARLRSIGRRPVFARG